MSCDLVKSLSLGCERLRNAVRSSNSICVTGPSSCGKTTLVTKVLEEQNDYLFVYISCELIPSTSKLYIDIYRGLTRGNKSLSIRKSVPSKVWSTGEFVDAYRRFRSRAKDVSKVFVVLDKVEVFKRTAILDGLMCLATLSELSIIYITTGTIMDLLDIIRPDSLRVKINLNTVVVNLDNWSKSCIVETILKQRPVESFDLYKKFVQNIVQTVYSAKTRNFVELRSFCQQNFGSFMEFYRRRIVELIMKAEKITDEDLVDDELVEEFEVQNNIVARILTVYLDSLKESLPTLKTIGNWNDEVDIDRKVEVNMTMLIIAVYIASHTTPADDKRNFVKLQKKKLARKGVDKVNAKSKDFSLERLLHIHKGLVHLQLGISTDKLTRDDYLDYTLTSIQTLEDLNVIRVIRGDGLDSNTKYRISDFVTKVYIERLAKQVYFDIDSICGL